MDCPIRNSLHNQVFFLRGGGGRAAPKLYYHSLATVTFGSRDLPRKPQQAAQFNVLGFMCSLQCNDCNVIFYPWLRSLRPPGESGIFGNGII